MIIQSGNDASVALAEHVAGSEDVFAGLMNKHAQNLGMTTALIKEEGTTAPLQTGRVTAAPDHEISSLSELISLVSR